MKKLVFLIIFIFVSQYLKAQFDTIVMVTGRKIPAIVKEISDKVIKYKNPRDSLGPTLVIKKNLIERFILRNGCIDMKEIGYDNCVKDPTYKVIKNEEFKSTLVCFDVAQSAISHLQLSTEFITKNRKLGFVFHGNYGWQDPDFKSTFDRLEVKVNPVPTYKNAYYYKLFALGTSLKIYPTSHKKWTYFMSFGLDFGKSIVRFNRIVTTKQFDPQWGYVVSVTQNQVTEKYASSFQTFNFNNGVVVRFSKRVIMQMYFISGMNRFKYPKDLSVNFEKKSNVATAYIFRYGLGLNLGLAF